MFRIPPRMLGWLRIRTTRTALGLLIVSVAFVSGFGAPVDDPRAANAEASFEPAATDAGADASGPAHVGARSSGLRASWEDDSRPNSRVVAEYAPIRIESLPIHAPELGEGPWASGANMTLVTRGALGRGESLSRSLRRQGIDSATVHLVAREMASAFDFRRSRPGDRYRLVQDPEGMVLEFRFSQGPERSWSLRWDTDHYVVSEDIALLRTQLAKVSGLVESSLYDAVKELGEQPQLAADFADIFAWDIDFSRSVRPGDDFQILYERLYRTDDDGAEIYVKPGRILAARYRGLMGERAAVYFAGEDDLGGYYRPDGSSIERAFLMAPLEFRRISSSFSRARQHPILKVVRPHPGIDYAAARGTPLWAIGDGRVIYRGWAGASGNLVKIRHMNGYVSSYAHLSGFQPNLAVGQRVKQKQVIGYVGDTGLATGPHVCFRMQRNGHYVNPLEIASPPGEAIERHAWKSFQLRRDLLLSDLGRGTLVAADEAL
ncbi:MAG: M23 family metallopeptidase [Deltaproteobacteria bacterium]|nr:M23 family metallopeptidase [Deltaproteobacteria bacterium]MBW2382327.1 M23 family metallopeptidase [Deltaproteobacteria bacterium]MBW2698026.1 M23 family metallopeptidase [Deltaproteobacteria bacterium]